MTTIPDDIMKVAITVSNVVLLRTPARFKLQDAIARAILAERERNAAEIAALRADNERLRFALRDISTDQGERYDDEHARAIRMQDCAHAAMLGIVAARSSLPVKIVARGSTPSSAAAADRHEKPGEP